MKRSRILIDFAEPIELPDWWLDILTRVLGIVCALYEKEHPGRIMWPFGQGSMMMRHPLAIADDEPIPFDDTTYHIEVAEREASVKERNYGG